MLNNFCFNKKKDPTIIFKNIKIVMDQKALQILKQETLVEVERFRATIQAIFKKYEQQESQRLHESIIPTSDCPTCGGSGVSWVSDGRCGHCAECYGAVFPTNCNNKCFASTNS